MYTIWIIPEMEELLQIREFMPQLQQREESAPNSSIPASNKGMVQ